MKAVMAAAATAVVLLAGTLGARAQTEPADEPTIETSTESDVSIAHPNGAGDSAQDVHVYEANRIDTRPEGKLFHPRSSYPDFPDDAELERMAREVPASRKASIFPGDNWSGQALYPMAPASPVFSFESDVVVGISVNGLGLIDRATYDDPNVDFDMLAIEKFGAATYNERLAHDQHMATCTASAATGEDVHVCLADG